MLWNAQSINNKISILIQILEDNSIDICCLSETWLQSQKNTVTANLREAGYRIYHFNRTKKIGGGVAVLSKYEYKPKLEKSFNYTSFECIIQTLKTSSISANLTIIVVYRLDVSFPLFLDEFNAFVEYVKLKFKYFVMCGDFNIHVNKSTRNETIKFMEILNAFSLTQTIDTSTHKLGNTLDLLIYDPECIIIKDIHVDSTDLIHSDHYCIYFKLFYNMYTSTREEITYRNFKNVDMSQFKEDIIVDTNNYVREANGYDFDSCVQLYFDMYGSTVDRHAPVIKKVVNMVNRPPWMDSEYVVARKQRRQLYKKWLKEKTNTNRTNFEQSRAAVEVLANDKRCTFYQDSIKNANNVQKELFKLCNNLFDTTNKSQLPYSEDHTTLANKFNTFFVQKIEKIRLDLSSSSTDHTLLVPNNNTISTLSNFKLVTVEDIEKQVKIGKVKTSVSDPMPSFLLKSCIHLMVPAIVHLVNASLRNGSMDGLKESVVTPILKKAGLDQDLLANYRPVCGGLYIDKVIQKNVLEQLNLHMTENNLHIPYQSAYKPYHSCETVLLALNNDILLNLDKGLCTVVILLDNSAAFDTVDHDELILDLSNEIGVRDTALKWFKSFLNGRKQVTCVKGKKSTSINTRYGVPQGSVVGPVLFNIYIRNFIKLLQDAGFGVHGYADDHQVTTTFRIEFQFSTLCHSLPKLLNLISKWMGSRFLKLNASKTKLLIFSPKNLEDNVYIDNVYLGNNVALPVTHEEMNLGFKFDSHLSCSPQINMVLRQSYRYISDIGKVKKFLSSNDLRSLIQAVIISRIDNCNSLYYGIQESELNRLQCLQNSCARLIYGRRKHDHVSDIFIELHWLPVKQRVIFKILLFVFKVFVGMSPLYLETCFTVVDRDNRILLVPRVCTAYGDRAFSNSAPRLWNALPDQLRKAETLNFFKAHLKHHLFTNFNAYANEVNRYRIFLNNN